METEGGAQSGPPPLLRDLRSAIGDLTAHINVPGNQVGDVARKRWLQVGRRFPLPNGLRSGRKKKKTACRITLGKMASHRRGPRMDYFGR